MDDFTVEGTALSARAALDAFLKVPRKLPKAQEKALLDLAVQATLVIDDQIVRTYAWGKPTSTRTIILSHGLGENAASMLFFVAPLLKENFRVLAFDHLGHGTSEGDQADLGAFVGTLKALAEACETLTAIIGHSAGATTAVMALADNPTIQCESLVCLSPPMQTRTLFARFSRARGLPLSIVSEMHEAMVKSQLVSPEKVIAEQMAQRVTSRTLIVHDEDDDFVPLIDSSRLAECIDGSRLEVTEGLGHYDGLQDPHVIGLVVRFLTKPSYNAYASGSDASHSTRA